MNDWNPHNLFHCLDSNWLAWLNIALCLGVVGWYFAIAFSTWLPGMRGASAAARRSMGLMAAIFVFCALAGYGTVALASYWPRAAFVIRTIALVALNIACPWFLASKANQDFKAIGRQQQVGADVITAIVANKSDKQIADMVRKSCEAT